MKHLKNSWLLLVIVWIVFWPMLATAQSSSQVRQAQERLKAAGLEPGGVDGILGPKTKAALQQYQAAHGLQVSGTLDAATRKSLGLEGLEGAKGAKKRDSLSSQRLIPEAGAFITRPPRGEPTGVITIKPNEDDCRRITFSVDVAVHPDNTGQVTLGEIGQLEPGDRVVFYSGVKHVYVGHACFPDKARYNASINVRSTPGPSAKMGIIKDKIVVSGGPVNLSGTVSVEIPNNTHVFEVETDTSEPLILLTTTKGYKYVSGRGTVITPSGKLYDFRSKSE